MQKGNNLNEPFRFSRHVINFHTLVLSTGLTLSINERSGNSHSKKDSHSSRPMHMYSYARHQ